MNGIGVGVVVLLAQIYLWVLIAISFLSLILCSAFSEAEQGEAGLTGGGRAMVGARILMGACCISGYWVNRSMYQSPLSWVDSWQKPFAWMLCCDLIVILTLIAGYKARGTRRWLYRATTPILLVVSLLVTCLLYVP